jgi:hypothetical protein
MTAICNGGGGALGHPTEYIQLNTVKPGEVRFEQTNRSSFRPNLRAVSGRHVPLLRSPFRPQKQASPLRYAVVRLPSEGALRHVSVERSDQGIVSAFRMHTLLSNPLSDFEQSVLLSYEPNVPAELAKRSSTKGESSA